MVQKHQTLEAVEANSPFLCISACSLSKEQAEMRYREVMKMFGEHTRPLLAAFLGCLMFLLVCSSITGCRHDTSAVSKNPPEANSSGPHYAHLFGQSYRTKVDLYLFIFKA